MTTVTCDRCGREIHMELPEFHRVEVMAGDGWSGHVKLPYDLCRDCRTALVGWIRKGVQDDQV